MEFVDAVGEKAGRKEDEYDRGNGEKWFEIDFTYPILKFLAWIKVIRFIEVKA